LNVAIYGDTAKESNRFSLKVSDRTLDQFTLEASARVQLAAGASDIAMCVGSLTSGQLLCLKSERAFTVKLNGIGTTAIKVTPRTNSTDGVVVPAIFVLMTDTITSVHLGNSGSEAITVDYGLAGV